MIFTLLSHQWKSFWRGRGVGKSIAMQLFLGFIILYLLASCFVLGLELGHLIGRDRIENRQRPVAGRNAVVRGRDGQVRTPNIQTAFPQALECLWRGHFVDQMQIYIDKTGRTGFFMDDVRVPNFLR